MKIAKLNAKGICRVEILVAGFVVALMMFAPYVTAQVEYVDPTIGNVGILLVPTRPAVFLPNSMVRVYPIRTDALNDQIDSFPLTISSHRMHELFSIMPGERGPAAYDQEKTTPYYLSTRFDGSLITVEFSPTERCGYFRFVFPDGKASVVLANRLSGDLRVQDGVVVGEENFDGMKAYVYGEFSSPVASRWIDIKGGNRMTASDQ